MGIGQQHHNRLVHDGRNTVDLLLQDRMYALGAYIFQTTAGQHLKISDSRHTLGDADGILEDSIMNRSYTNTQKR
ncbi:hypothetical protein, partial [Corynebacterium diphtheriae]|uniref:hypothetical protein n=1 Tax=Corynebacterium diphtheriae TaxID=1717 RepID=UPI001C4FBADC